MRLLLDTCAFLWVVSDDPRLSKKARYLFADPDNDVYLSAASAWEIAVKATLGRLPLPGPAEMYVPRARETHGIATLPLDEVCALQVQRLPPIHRDPFDRMIVAQAVAHGLVIVTPDDVIRRYSVRTAW